MVTRLALFRGKGIRKTINNNEWWFVVEDVVLALIESKDPKQYIQRMKQRDPELGKGWGQIATPLLLETEGGKQRVNCANTEGLFRIIQSIPSPKAEPFKRWLAKVGYERVQEIEDPELATKRAKAMYQAKGYSGEWIEKRMRGIAIRTELTDEWKKRRVGEEKEYAILTSEISKAPFGLTPSEDEAFQNVIFSDEYLEGLPVGVAALAKSLMYSGWELTRYENYGENPDIPAFLIERDNRRTNVWVRSFIEGQESEKLFSPEETTRFQEVCRKKEIGGAWAVISCKDVGWALKGKQDESREKWQQEAATAIKQIGTLIRLIAEAETPADDNV